MEKYQFMELINESFEGLKTEEAIDKRAEEMIKIISQAKELSKGYLRVGIL